MLRSFFLFETELPQGSGFPLFGLCHCSWLVSIMIVAALSGHAYRRLSVDRQKRWNKRIGMLFPVLSVYRDLVLVLTGHYGVGFLPFHLCSMAMWIAAIYCFTDNRFLGVVYVLLCVPGASGALLFPDWNAYPLWNYMHIHDFLSHGLIVVFGVCLVCSDRIVTTWKDLWYPALFGVIGMFLFARVNRMLHTNYWFVSQPSADSPLVWILEKTGELLYPAGFFLFCLVVVAIWEGMILIYRRVRGSIGTIG